MKRFILVSIAFAFQYPLVTSAITVEEAYQAIPHKQTRYDAGASTRDAAEKAYLSKLFTLSDRALIERIETMRALNAGNSARFTAYKENIAKIRTEILALKAPQSAHGLNQLLADAISLQEKFFARWSDAVKERSTPPQLGADKDVRAASTMLIQLYSTLMSRYANENPRNREAFYQHLCALDFI